MTHLWTRTRTSTRNPTPPESAASPWALFRLDGAPAWDMSEIPPRPIAAESRAAPSVALRRVAGNRWLLVHSGDHEVRVNGWPIHAGIRCLDDRDELRIGRGGESFFFSTERRAEVESFPGGGARVSCPRCHQHIAAGTPVVRCTYCTRAFHMTDQFPCFVSAERCPQCDAVTRFDADFRWTPEDV